MIPSYLIISYLISILIVLVILYLVHDLEYTALKNKIDKCKRNLRGTSLEDIDTSKYNFPSIDYTISLSQRFIPPEYKSQNDYKLKTEVFHTEINGFDCELRVHGIKEYISPDSNSYGVKIEDIYEAEIMEAYLKKNDRILGRDSIRYGAIILWPLLFVPATLFLFFDYVLLYMNIYTLVVADIITYMWLDAIVRNRITSKLSKRQKKKFYAVIQFLKEKQSALGKGTLKSNAFTEEHKDIYKRLFCSFLEKVQGYYRSKNEEWWTQLSPTAFEIEIAKWYESKGYKAKVTPPSGDGGVDVIIEKDGVKTYIQCKHYNSWRIGVETVRELYGVAKADNVDNCILACLHANGRGGLTQEAQHFVDKTSMKLVTLKELTDGQNLRSGQPWTIEKDGSKNLKIGDLIIEPSIYIDNSEAKKMEIYSIHD